MTARTSGATAVTSNPERRIPLARREHRNRLPGGPPNSTVFAGPSSFVPRPMASHVVSHQ